MKIIRRLSVLILTAISIGAANVQAAQTERPITFALTGFFQATNTLGGYVAIPFRVTTKDILVEISLTTGQDFTNGILLQIESLIDTNAPIQIVARKGFNQMDVSGFFDSALGNYVSTETVRKGTFYAIDYFAFSTLNTDTNGFELEFQGFTKEIISAVTKKVGSASIEFFSKNLRMDGIGEMRFIDDFLGPVKGSIKIGSPKVVATPLFFSSQSAISHQSITTPLPPLP